MKKKVNKIIAIAIAVVLTIIMVLGVLYIVSSQISMLSNTYPALKLKFNISSGQIVQWISQKFNVRVSKINEWVTLTQTQAVSNLVVGEKLTEAGQMLLTGVLLPVYLFRFYITNLC